jgi:hypothetical protein
MKESKFSITKLKESKLSAESALEQVRRFCLEFDIDIDATEDKKQRANMENLLNALTEYVQRGLVEFNEDGTIVQHTKAGEDITYKRVTGEQKLAMDGFEETERYAMMYAVLGAASGLGATAIRKLYGTDLKVAEGLALAFL